MTHLKIEQNNSAIEQVSSAVITKLYELATSGELDLDSNLVGRLSTTVTYLEYIDALHTAYPDLYINSDNIYIMFEDPEVLNVLLANNIGDGVGVTIAQAATALIDTTFYNNTNITSFDNYDKFTKANTRETSFLGCTNLRSINLSNNTVLAQDGFKNCTSLTSVNIGGGNGSRYGVFRGCTSLLSVTLPSSFTTLRENFFDGCSNLTTINLSNVQTIKQYAFAGCSKLTTVDLSNCTSLSYESFTGCTSLATVTLSPQLTSIGLGTFKNCSSLSSIDLSHITSIGGSNNYGAFQGCSSLTSVTLNPAITSIPVYCFYNCSSLTSVTLPSTCTTIEREAFRGCTNLTSIDTSNVTSMGYFCFDLCTNLTSLDFSNVTGFYKAVGSTHVTRGVFPKMTTISDSAFEYSPFVYLEFGENLTSIGIQAFWGSTGLRTLVFRSTTPPSFNTTNSNRFLYDMSNLTIYVPDASVNDYKTAWSAMTNQITGISNLPQS